MGLSLKILGPSFWCEKPARTLANGGGLRLRPFLDWRPCFQRVQPARVQHALSDSMGRYWPRLGARLNHAHENLRSREDRQPNKQGRANEQGTSALVEQDFF